MKTLLHALAGTVALLCILMFWCASLLSELLLDQATIAQVKLSILYGMGVLIPALIITGGSGFALAKHRQGRLLAQKQRRMPIIALNGLLILVPSAFYLQSKASMAQFDTSFIVIQCLELLAGAVNFVLLGMNFKDGLRLAGRRLTAKRA